MSKKLTVSSSPHFTEGLTTQKIMACVLIAMLPECIAGIVFFGLSALVKIVVSVFGCVLFEALFQKLRIQRALYHILPVFSVGCGIKQHTAARDLLDHLQIALLRDLVHGDDLGIHPPQEHHRGFGLSNADYNVTPLPQIKLRFPGKTGRQFISLIDDSHTQR